MLTTVLIYIAGAFVGLISGALGKISNVLFNTDFVNSVNYFVAKLGYLTAILNIPDILEAIGWLLTFTTALLSFRLVLWIYGLIPFFGKKVSPKI